MKKENRHQQEILSRQLFIVDTTNETKIFGEIAGCFDINKFNKLKNLNNSHFQNFIPCFCQLLHNNFVNIKCLYGSKLDDLKQALRSTINANFIAKEVVSSLSGKFDYLKVLRQIYSSKFVALENCYQKIALKIDENAFNGQEENLEEIYIEKCNLDETIVNRLPTLLKKFYFKNFQLKMLNLAANFIETVDNETFSQLKDSLEILIIGEHNYINETVFNEISKLTELKILDLSKADGILEIPNGLFAELNKLETLLMIGCSLTKINNGTFQGLHNLIELDLRINLIDEIECGSFRASEKLRKLSLGGNYLNTTKNCTWNGLHELVSLDLGWNELAIIDNVSFTPLSKSLTVLDLRHNTKLNSLFIHLISLKELDLNTAKLNTIESDSFKYQANSLEKLDLSNNNLKTLPVDALKSLKHLKYLDLSSNKWICDDRLKKGNTWPSEKNLKRAESGDEFKLVNAKLTLCDRPYSLKGEIITDVEDNLLLPYDSFVDITTTVIMIATNNNISVENDTSEIDDSLYKAESFISYSNDNLTIAFILLVSITVVSIAIIVAVVRFIKVSRLQVRINNNFRKLF
ncbi:unnamed protein product [Dracunculus medinensis]|uniref:LRRCT domain-containing protein n=1 Tax=Dracunculus medinensis TaxID=318479 RepID=A0A3P7S5P1_DRAME|nr:unnamed protein product [Dracunculus medinensis]